MPVTLSQLSQIVGLSPTTVSRALNGYPEVNAETRKRVEAAAKACGYVPNRQARRLATGRTMSIGHVLCTSGHDMMNPISLEFMAGAGEVYAGHGYDMLLTVTGEGSEEDSYRELAEQRKVDGVVLYGPRLGDRRPELLDRLGIPFVLQGRVPGLERTTNWVDLDNHDAFERATAHLLGLGHRRIALLNGPQTIDFAMRRRAGFEASHRTRGLEPDPALIFSAEMTEPFGYDAAMELTGRADPPTAYLVSSLFTALGVQRALAHRRLTLGRDVALVTHDDVLSFLPNGGDTPIFSCTRSPVREAGALAAKLLIARLDGQDSERVGSRLLTAGWVPGKSSMPLAG